MSQAGLFDDLPHEAGQRHSLLLASAGTGKTYRLAGHFAALLLLGVEPERVLATTFTRKAAGEILDRVLARVRDAAHADAERERMALDAEIQRLAPGTARLSAGHCQAVLAQLTRRVNRFRVRTIDAFFVRLAKLFAAELEMSPQWRITDDVEERTIVREVVARVLDSLEFDERLELLRGMTRGTATRGAEAALVAAIEQAEAIGREAEPGAWGRIPALAGVEGDALERAVRVVVEWEAPKNKNGKPNAHWSAALKALRERLDPLDPEASFAPDLLDVGLVQKAIDGAPFSKHPVNDDLRAALLVLSKAVYARMTAALIARNHSIATFLEHYLSADNLFRREEGAYRFQDFSRVLLDGPLRLAHDEWLSELGYRLDGGLDHLLLDEFQDTGAGQWRLLQPLADEVLAGGYGRSFFCVGDVKQSIYGWRGGEPRLLAGMGDRYPALVEETMAKSYRSSAVVLDAVNLVFAGIDRRTCLGQPGNEAALEATEAWVQGFERHEAARTELAGEARLWRARPHDAAAGEKALDPALLLAVERVCAIHAEQPRASIAVLVRAKSQIARLRFLLSRRGVESSDEGGNPLTDSLGVTWILGLLQLADHPSDGFARLQVARSPLGERFGLSVESFGSAGGATGSGLEAGLAAARAVRDALLRQGYGEFVGECVRGLSDTASAWDARRLEQLVDLALAYDERATLRPMDFVDLVRERRVPDPTASRVNVMTIHASKGLEFDAVVLPELGKAIRLTPDDFIAGRDDIVDPPTVATARPKRMLANAHPVLGELYAAEERRSMTDALSTLYVAMTRAVHGLEMIIPVAPASSAALQHATLLAPPLEEDGSCAREGDEDAESETERAALLWQHPDSSAQWTVDGADAGASDYALELTLTLGAGTADAAVSRPSGAQERRPTSAAGLLAPSEPEGQRLGTAVHALFEGLAWIEDEARSDGELERASGGHADAVALYRRALASPAAKALLGRPGGDAVVLTERSFDVEVSDLDVDPFRVSGTVDRLVLHREAGRITRAEVVDYKTDAEGSPAALLGAHGDQLRAYRLAVQALFSLDACQVSATILWVSATRDAAAVPLP